MNDDTQQFEGVEDEQDLVVFTDDQGNNLTLEVLDYFFYNGQEYAVLADAAECDCDCEDEEDSCECGCDHCHEEEQNLYIMKVVAVDDDMEEFVPVEEGLMETLIEVVQTRFEAEDEDDEDEDDEEEDDKE